MRPDRGGLLSWHNKLITIFLILFGVFFVLLEFFYRQFERWVDASLIVLVALCVLIIIKLFIFRKMTSSKIPKEVMLEDKAIVIDEDEFLIEDIRDIRLSNVAKKKNLRLYYILQIRLREEGRYSFILANRQNEAQEYEQMVAEIEQKYSQVKIRKS